jgi:hypothetical protein
MMPHEAKFASALVAYFHDALNKPDRNDVRGVAQMSCASQRGLARFLSQTRS